MTPHMRLKDRTVFQLSRREFCQFAATCSAAVGLSACVDGNGFDLVGVGPIHPGDGVQPGDPDAGPDTPDGAPGSPDGHPAADARPGTPDGAPPPPADAGGTGPACTSSTIDVGAPSTFALNTATYFSAGDFFVVRDSGGLFALSSLCTHEGYGLVVKSGHFYCGRHGATFAFSGSVTNGPAFQPLQHFMMCMASNGHVAVETSIGTSSSTRLNA
jgi:cytochrome b6-f complex iron-sulfur subunit